jgi:hypothetical protein
MNNYPNFRAALLKLASTNRERATLLGVSERSIANYLSSTTLPSVEKVKRFPELDDALTRDLRPSQSEVVSIVS